eukprot:s4283_g2.t1
MWKNTIEPDTVTISILTDVDEDELDEDEMDEDETEDDEMEEDNADHRDDGWRRTGRIIVMIFGGEQGESITMGIGVATAVNARAPPCATWWCSRIDGRGYTDAHRKTMCHMVVLAQRLSVALGGTRMVSR